MILILHDSNLEENVIDFCFLVFAWIPFHPSCSTSVIYASIYIYKYTVCVFWITFFSFESLLNNSTTQGYITICFTASPSITLPSPDRTSYNFEFLPVVILRVFIPLRCMLLFTIFPSNKAANPEDFQRMCMTAKIALRRNKPGITRASQTSVILISSTDSDSEDLTGLEILAIPLSLAPRAKLLS